MGSDVYRETVGDLIADRLELDNLVMIAHKQGYLAADQARLTAGLNDVTSSVADQRSALANINGFQAARRDMSAMPATASSPTSANGTTATDPSMASESSDAGIINRSPTTINHYYPVAPTPAVPTPTPAPVQPGTRKLPSWWPWLLTIPLLGGLAAAWYFWPKPVQPPAETLTPGASKIGISVTPGS